MKDHVECWDRKHCSPTVLERYLAEAVSLSFVTPFGFLDTKAPARRLALLTADAGCHTSGHTHGCERDNLISASAGSHFEPCRFWDCTFLYPGSWAPSCIEGGQCDAFSAPSLTRIREGEVSESLHLESSNFQCSQESNRCHVLGDVSTCVRCFLRGQQLSHRRQQFLED